VVKPVSERRRDSRFGRGVIAAMRAVLRPGRAVSLVNVSAGGALVESPRPLRPGSDVHLQLTTGHRSFGLSARVLRCAVAAIDSTGVLYRGALSFANRCDALWESATRD
jgi:PilZ domain-containing protein